MYPCIAAEDAFEGAEEAEEGLAVEDEEPGFHRRDRRSVESNARSPKKSQGPRRRHTRPARATAW